MKKIITISLILSLLFAFTSCDSKTKNNQKEKELLEKSTSITNEEKKKNQAVIKNNSIGINEEFLISNGKVGIFEIGHKPPTHSKYNIIKKTQTVYSDYNDEPDEIGTEQIYYSVSDNNNELLNYYVKDDLINRILIFSDKFETSKKIGVNSTIEEFMKAYPDYKMDDGDFIFRTKEINGYFILDARDYIGDSEKPVETNSDLDINSEIKYTNIKFKKNSKILNINIY